MTTEPIQPLDLGDTIYEVVHWEKAVVPRLIEMVITREWLNNSGERVVKKEYRCTGGPIGLGQVVEYFGQKFHTDKATAEKLCAETAARHEKERKAGLKDEIAKLQKELSELTPTSAH